MSVSPTWAAALAVAVATGAVALVGLLTGGRSRFAAALAPLLHLLAGGLAGFMALAFYPAWPLLAAIVGMLAIRAAQSRRWTDLSLLAAGFGVTWALLFGWAIILDALDPAVTSTGDDRIPFAIGVAILVSAIVFEIWQTARPNRFAPPR